MSWTLFNALLAIIAVAALVSIWRERCAHDRELRDKMIRLYRGGLL